MSAEDVRQFLQNTKVQRQDMQQAFAEAQEQARRQAEQASEVQGRLQEARGELLAALLPALTPEALSRGLALTGYAGLRDQAAVFDALAQERTRLERRRSEVEADESFANRELLIHPVTGSLTRRIAELEDYAVGFRSVVERCQHPRLAHLLEVGYGTGDYAVPFWRLSYYSDWKAGDEVLEQFPDKEDFGQVLAEYRRAMQVLEVYEPELSELRAGVTRCQELQQEHADLNASLSGLAQRHLEDLRGRLGRFMEGTGLAALASRLAADPEVELLAKRWDGLGRQREYLDGISGQLHAHQQAMDQELRSMDRTITKWSRPKSLYKPLPEKMRQRAAVLRGERYRKRLARNAHYHTTVYAFSDYHHGRLLDDFLWWDLFTDGRLDGDFLPEVQRFHGRHPDYRYERVLDDADAEAAAAVAALDAEEAAALASDIS